jgi:hypothetical protein
MCVFHFLKQAIDILMHDHDVKLFSDFRLCAFVQWPPPLGNPNGDFPLERLWDPGIELLHEDELDSACISVENLVDKPNLPWSQIAPISSTNEFGSNTRAVSEPLDIIAITIYLQIDFAAWYIFRAKVVFYSTENMQHWMLEKLKPGLSLELHVLVLVIMRKEVVFWPMFQSTSCDAITLLPWDPGDLRYGTCTNSQITLAYSVG